MESIVTKVLGSYLKRFIKNFNKEMLTLQVMKGTVQIKDFALSHDVSKELQGDVLQELMAIPTNLEIVSAKCTELIIKIPFMNLKHEPITFSLDRIDINLAEPETIKPMPNILQSMNQSNLSERAEKMSMIRGIKMELKECHMTVQTMGRDTFHTDWKPGLKIEVKGMVVQSVNNKWEVVDLAATQEVDAAKGVTLLYKLMKIHSISMYSLMTTNESPVPIIEDLPIEIRSITQFDSKTNLWKSSSIEVIFEELNISLTQGKWQRLANLGLSMRACFAREVPLRPSEPIEEKMNMLSYGLTLHRFVIELLKGQQGGEEGFTFFGFNLQCSLSPARLINYIIKDLGGRGRDQPVSCWESIFNFGVQSVTFRERKPTQDKEPMYMRILSQSGEAKKEGAFQAKDPSLVSVQLYHRTKIEADEATKRKVPTFELHGSMHGIQMVIDKQAFKELYSFIIEGPVEDGLQAQGEKLKDKLKDRASSVSSMEESLEDLKNYMYINTKFDIEATETTLILPNIPNSAVEDLRTKALHFGIGKVTLTNQPDWPFPPFLKDAFTILPEKKEQFTPEEGTVHKFQGELHRVTCDLRHIGGPTEEKMVPIVYPAIFRLYGRYFPPSTHELKTHKIEALFHASELRAQLTPTQLMYFHRMENENIEWGLKVEREERERRKMFKMMKAAASGVSEMKSSETGTSASSAKDLAIKFKDNAPQIITDSIKYFFDNIHVTSFVRLEKATFSMPSPGGWVTIFNNLHRDVNAEDKGKGKIPEELLAEDKILSELSFEKFEIACDNCGTSQSAVLKLKAVKATGLEHPRFPAGALLRPLPSLGSDAQALWFQFLRNAPPGGKASTRLWGRLQGVQVVSVGKHGSIEQAVRDLIPELRQVFTQAMERYQKTAELRQKVGKHVKEGAQVGLAITKQLMEGGLEALNPSWRLEMGDCEFKHVDSMDQIDAEGEVPRGIVKLSSSNKEALSQQFSEIEEQLIQSRLSLAQSESEKFDLRTQIDQTENKFTKLQQEMKTLEQQLVSTKMQFAEVQAENDNLKTEIKKVQQGGSTSAPKKGLFGRK